VRCTVLDLREVDLPVLLLPDDTYVAVYPAPMCHHRHETADEAVRCIVDAQRFLERPEPMESTQTKPV